MMWFFHKLLGHVGKALAALSLTQLGLVVQHCPLLHEAVLQTELGLLQSTSVRSHLCCMMLLEAQL